MVKKKTTRRDNTQGQYEDCFVAFLDILGFARLVNESVGKPETLQSIITAMKVVGDIPRQGEKQIRRGSSSRTLQLRSRFFSDTLVFFLKKKPNDIAQLFFVIRYLQDQLWQSGFCLRGSIVLGQMYWSNDSNVTVGPGLIDAYKQENGIAIYPRITVSPQLRSYIAQNECDSVPFSASKDTRLLDLIRTDADGVHFLDLLNPSVARFDGEGFADKQTGHSFSIIYDQGRQSTHQGVLQHVNAEKLYLNPDCGFGTFAERCVNTPETAYRKLKAIGEAAELLRREFA
jgi:hypothetical protein